jgi:hypothetical protein
MVLALWTSNVRPNGSGLPVRFEILCILSRSNRHIHSNYVPQEHEGIHGCRLHRIRHRRGSAKMYHNADQGRGRESRGMWELYTVFKQIMTDRLKLVKEAQFDWFFSFPLRYV